MVNELELRFDDEAGVYLPQVVAEENRRKANELERIANEEQRKANESERITNEEYRKETMKQIEENVDNLIDEMNVTLSKISFIKRYEAMYVTESEGETTFELPIQYTSTSLLDVRVNGFSLNTTEYIVDLLYHTVVLAKPVDIGTPVEILVTRLTTAEITDYEALKGEKGDKGDTPVKGVDYWTSNDQNSIETFCTNYIDTQFSTILDEINGEEV